LRIAPMTPEGVRKFHPGLRTSAGNKIDLSGVYLGLEQTWGEA